MTWHKLENDHHEMSLEGININGDRLVNMKIRKKVRDNKGLCGIWRDVVAKYVFKKAVDREMKSATKFLRGLTLLILSSTNNKTNK